MRLVPALLGFALSSCAFASAQTGIVVGGKPKSYVVYAAEAQTIPAKKPAVLELRFQVLDGYHVNSHRPGSQLLIPTAVTLEPATGVKVGEPQYPRGMPYSFSFDPGTKLDVYAGTFTVKLPVIVSAGEHILDGTLKYQACDNASCYPPRTVPLKVLFNAK
jgi:DsbC/DsbD-like thiol-disulfide interchange protein